MRTQAALQANQSVRKAARAMLKQARRAADAATPPRAFFWLKASTERPADELLPSMKGAMTFTGSLSLSSLSMS